METPENVRKILWAVDAFADPERLKTQAPELLNAIAKSGPISVQPVYVLSPGQINLSLEFSGPWINEYRPAAEKMLNETLSQVQVPGLLPPMVLVEDYVSTTEAADRLSKHALETGAELIVVTTHARHGLGRLLIGSFAETLLLRSKIPVLVIGPQNRIPAGIRNILFPTEFGPRAESAFRAIVREARRFGAKITLFHAIPHPVESVLQSGVYLLGGFWAPAREYFSSETERQMRRAEGWANWGRNRGVEVEPWVDIQGESIVDSILYLARNRSMDLIAMEAHSGPLRTALIGSVTRQVVRHAECPVWVIRGPAASKAAGARKAPGTPRAA